MSTTVSSLAQSRILVVTATASFRHESIPTAEAVLSSLASEQNIEVAFARTAEEMLVQMTPAALRDIRAVFFVNTTGDLPFAAADALVAWVESGGTFVGVHSASDTWHSVPAYLDMLGGEFIGHPPETNAVVFADDATHLATRDLPPQHVLFEEFYSLGRVNLSMVRTLLSLRQRPEPPGDAGYWPLAWEKGFGRGRVLYTALGHRDDVWRSAWFQLHVAGILRWAVQPQESGRRRATRH